MNAAEVVTQQARVNRFFKLKERYDRVYEARKFFDDAAFTGNTRESRLILNMKIWFSETQGGAPAIDICSSGEMALNAYEIGQLLRERLTKRLELIAAEMEKV